MAASPYAVPDHAGHSAAAAAIEAAEEAGTPAEHSSANTAASGKQFSLLSEDLSDDSVDEGLAETAGPHEQVYVLLSGAGSAAGAAAAARLRPLRGVRACMATRTMLRRATLHRCGFSGVSGAGAERLPLWLAQVQEVSGATPAMH